MSELHEFSERWFRTRQNSISIPSYPAIHIILQAEKAQHRSSVRHITLSNKDKKSHTSIIKCEKKLLIHSQTSIFNGEGVDVR